jgi:hypothetical protein
MKRFLASALTSTSTLTLTLTFLGIHLFAQNINQWAESQKTALYEKVYLHIDRELYAPGDTIRFKSYLVSGITHKLEPGYKNIYVQLVSPTGEVVANRLLLSIFGEVSGDIVLEDSLAEGQYIVRARTKYLENFGEESFFHKRIWVAMPKSAISSLLPKTVDLLKIDAMFFPEGGNLVLNAANQVAFKVVGEDGKSIEASGRVLEENGDTVTTFKTSYLGMGKFVFMPLEGKTYFATIDSFPDFKYEFNNFLTYGISLDCRDEGAEMLAILARNIKSEGGQTFYLVATHKGVPLFYREVRVDGIGQASRLGKNLFPLGISKLTVMDPNLNVAAERLIFIDVNYGVSSADIALQKESFNTREKVELSVEPFLAPGDSIESTLSVAVVNEDYFSSTGNNQTIKSYLLLDSELKGAIESPASYFFDDDSITSQEKLDLLMMVQGWRSYYWDDIAQLAPKDLEGWDDAGLSYGGYVKRLFQNQLVVGGEVTLGPFLPSFRYEKTKTDSLGRFKFNRLFIAGLTEVVFNARNEKGRKSTQIFPDPLPKYETRAAINPINQILAKPEIPLKFSTKPINKPMPQKKLAFDKGSILLGEVEVLAKKWDKFEDGYNVKSPIRKPDRTFILTENDYFYSSNIYLYLHHLQQELTNFHIEGLKMSYFLNGSMGDLSNINLKDIYRIDFFKGGVYSTHAGTWRIEAALAVYTKFKNYDTPNKWGRNVIMVNGFNLPHEFYSPKYPLVETNNTKPDRRITLFWSPWVRVENGKASLDFYTCDNLGNYVAIVEGISKNGKIISGAKRFSVTEFNPSLKK